jgi:pimeloyl-ACP methyl ester carboxylesterase
LSWPSVQLREVHSRLVREFDLEMVVRLLLLAGLVGLGWSFVSFGPRRSSISTSNETARKALAFEADLADYDYKSSVKLPWLEGGYNNWTYKGMKVNYIDVGKEDGKEKPNLLLIHGFGASAYHWRYNIPVLARDYRVFAIDMLGFGLSEKPIMDYTAELWRDQTLAFLEEVVERDSHKPTVVCGNSLGGFTALYAAADEKRASKLINGCILVNAAGRFKSGFNETKKNDPVWLSSVKGAFQRFVIGLSFVYTKQPARINQVLRQVYPVNPSRVDDELVESIRYVFCSIVLPIYLVFVMSLSLSYPSVVAFCII